VYVEFNSECVNLAMILGPGSDAEWGIRVNQYKCDFSNLAPTG